MKYKIRLSTGQKIKKIIFRPQIHKEKKLNALVS